MDNVNEVFDAKVTIRGTLHTLTTIKQLLSESGNERRNTIFRSTQFVGHAFEHEPQLLQQAKPVVEYRVAHVTPVENDATYINNDSDVALKEQFELVPMFTREELVVEHHAIITSVQLIENVGDGDPSFVVKELAAVKKMIFSIEKFIKSKNDDMSEDSMAKQFVPKELESADGKPQSSISNVFIGEVSCDKFVPNLYDGESSKNDDISEDLVAKQFVQKELESADGKLPQSAISDVLNGEVSCDKFVHNLYDGKSSKLYYTDPKEYPSSSMTQLLQVAVPDQPSTQMVTDNLMDFNLSNLNESFTESQVNDNAGIDFDNTENPSLEDMCGISYIITRGRFLDLASF
ncbi:hypothetical protein Tco_0727373 [Tanacetum coccineum]|uniref:Uncharacterized protein n=1 Tax=Tanacetum coccineum TaxID=301880 RepID=A0ABQ4YJ19_9ASTR